MILCLANDYRYIGETSDVSSRLAGHRRDLRRRAHTNENLRNDFNLYGEPQFRFTVLYIGKEWSDKNTRVETESQLIKANKGKCYNTYASMSDRVGEANSFFGKKHSQATKQSMSEQKKGIPNDQLGRKINILGVEYPSIAQASRVLGHSRKYIRIRINDPLIKDWYFFENA